MSKVHDIITDKIIAALGAGVVPWHRPWKSSVTRHVNQNGRPYRGINPFLLDLYAADKGFETGVWLTFKNAQALGGKVKEGEKANIVVFWTTYMPDGETPDPETGKVKRVFVLRYYNVFNLDQTEGVKLPKKVQAMVDAANTPAGEHTPIEAAEAILAAYTKGPEVKHVKGAQAAYRPSTDVITIARPEDFDSPADYYATRFHEEGHATGAKVRLNRTGVTESIHFGDEKYSVEELIAEMTSVFLTAEAGIEATFDNSAAYIGHWKARLQADKQLIVTAAARAQRAADFILGRTFEAEVTEE